MLPVSAIIIDHTSERIPLLIGAIESILNNTALPSEILVVVDLSQEDYPLYLEDIKKFPLFNHPLVRFYRNEHAKGPAGARNYAIKLAQYEWLAFLDSDDLWHKEKLFYQWNFMQKRPFLKASHTRELWLKNQQVVQTPKRLESGTGKFLIEAFRHCLISMSSILIKKQVFFEIGGFDEKLLAAEDYDFWLRYLIQYPIGLVPNINNQPPTIKRSGGWFQTSMTKNIDVYRMYSLIKIYKNFYNILNTMEQKELMFQIKNRFRIINEQRKKYIFEPYIENLYQEITSDMERLNLLNQI
jgi:glycosyltransferase involved in cell wall biosynthesis